VSTARSYDAIAEFYDDDMGRNSDGRDVAYYRQFCAAAVAERPGRVLELGCGTGRITLALAEADITVTGIDLSVPMLRVLRRKAAARLHAGGGFRAPLLAAMDMARPGLEGPFSAVICPFSAFTYLLQDGERQAALAFVAGVLAPGGRFAMDVFISDPRIEASPADAEIFDYRRQLPDGGWLERHKTITPEVRPGVNRVRRRYTFLAADGAPRREIMTESHQRPCRVEELRQLIGEAGLRVVSVAGDFGGGEIGPESRVAIVEASR
jgi:ubiquinone/menaquinone biosynthesis C-methylase UbiE